MMRFKAKGGGFLMTGMVGHHSLVVMMKRMALVYDLNIVL